MDHQIEIIKIKTAIQSLGKVAYPPQHCKKCPPIVRNVEDKKRVLVHRLEKLTGEKYPTEYDDYHH
jgi:hypothetical protein